MRDDIPEAAYRLLTSLPVRTVERKAERQYEPGGKRLTFRGKVYPSLSEASRDVKRPREWIQKMMVLGEGHYL